MSLRSVRTRISNKRFKQNKRNKNADGKRNNLKETNKWCVYMDVYVYLSPLSFVLRSTIARHVNSYGPSLSDN